jgi:hypothetical protein
MLNAATTELSAPPPQTSYVTATYTSSPATLTLTGDGNASGLTINKQGSRVTITAGTNTKVNNASSVFFYTSSAFTLKGDMGAGNDQVSLIALQLSTLDLKLGDGNDSASLSYCNVTTCKVDGGTGTDSFVSTTSTIGSNQNTNIP